MARIRSIEINGYEQIPAQVVVLALGAQRQGIALKCCMKNLFHYGRKLFAIGVRVEHLQSEINRSQWHRSGQASSSWRTINLHSGRTTAAVYIHSVCAQEDM